MILKVCKWLLCLAAMWATGMTLMGVVVSIMVQMVDPAAMIMWMVASALLWAAWSKVPRPRSEDGRHVDRS